MKKNQTTSADSAGLRRRAEERLQENQKSQGPVASGQKKKEETQRLFHELQVHQIELEMQNEELLRARTEAEAVLERYTDLYDFAPIGYFTLDREGSIQQVNLAGATLLGQERSRLVRSRFGVFVAGADRPTFNDFLERAFASQVKESCEVSLREEDSPCSVQASQLVVRIVCTTSADGKTCRAVVADVTERRRAEAALAESEERFRTLADSDPDGIFRFDREFKLLYTNPVGAQWIGLEMPIDFPVANYGRPEMLTTRWETSARKVFETGRLRHFETAVERRGKVWTYEVLVAPELGRDGSVLSVISVARDITERKRAEHERETTVKFLRLVSRATSSAELTKSAVTFFQGLSGCEAVGIRLKAGDDYPYCEAQGFPEEFLLAENRLGARDEDGCIVLDSAGNPVIECVCGSVIYGRGDPEKPCFTEGGSYWVNDTPGLLATPTDGDRGTHTPNGCIGKGYESVALVPLGVGAERLGLLQLSDRRKGRFSPESIAFWEKLAVSLAVAIARSRAEEALLTANLRWQALMQAVPVGVSFSDDSTCRYITGNPAMVEQFEVRPQHNLSASASAAEAPGRRIRYFGEGRELQDTELPLQRAVLENRQIAHMELEVELPSGRRWFADASGSPVRDLSGKVIGGIAVTVDITERKAINSRLAYLASFPEQDSQPIIEADAQGRVRYANPTALSLFPRIREQGSAHPWLADWESLMRSHGEGSDPGAREVTIGEKKYHQGFYYLHDEQVLRVYGLDITDRKLAEEALHKANDQLVGADRRKNEFLDILSHELRNPLGPILNSLYIMERAIPGGAQAKRAHAVIDRQTTHLTSLVDDLLDLTRITRGKIHLQKERIELGELVRRTAEDYRGIFQARGIALDLLLCEIPVWIDGDATRVAQIVGNLLSNAAKFTHSEGRVELILEVEASAAFLRVRDNGVGIAAGVLQQLFQPFMQSAQTLDRTQGGLGLGLALVKGLVELHRGAVSASSEGSGRGAEFTVRLPRSEPEPSALQTAVALQPRPRRIVVIEDNADAADSLREVLQLMGHEVQLASTGQAGMTLACERCPDIVLCDIGLPGMSGYEVAQAMRANPQLQSTFLVALSGYAQPEDIARAQAAGFDLHLAKPLSIEQLEQLLAGPVTHSC